MRSRKSCEDAGKEDFEGKKKQVPGPEEGASVPRMN